MLGTVSGTPGSLNQTSPVFCFPRASCRLHSSSRLCMRPRLWAPMRLVRGQHTGLKRSPAERRERSVNINRATLCFQLLAWKTQALGRFSSSLKTGRTATATYSCPFPLARWLQSVSIFLSQLGYTYTYAVLVNWASADVFGFFNSMREEELICTSGNVLSQINCAKPLWPRK